MLINYSVIVFGFSFVFQRKKKYLKKRKVFFTDRAGPGCRLLHSEPGRRSLCWKGRLHAALLSGKGCNWGHSRDAWEGATDEKSRMARKELCSQGQTAQAIGGFPPWDPKLASVIPPCAPVASSPCRSCLFVPFFLQFDVGGVGNSSPSDFQFVLFLFDFHYPLPWLALAGGSSSGPVPGHKAFLFSWEPRRTLHEYVKGWFSFT